MDAAEMTSQTASPIKPWWEMKEARLRSAIGEIRQKEQLTIIQPFAVMDNDIPGLNVLFADDSYFLDEHQRSADIYFNQGYNPNLAALWRVTQTGRASVTACWFWDNHHLFESTIHAAMLADVSFCAHSYMSHYVGNELGRYAGFVPLCPIFWTNSTARQVLSEVSGCPRRNELYGGYNTYSEFPERNIFLRSCMEAIPSNVIKIREPHKSPDKDYYFNLPPADKLKDNCDYKVALCVSFGHNTTNRTFDALLSGQIPIVVGSIFDLDSIISPQDQAMLPLINIKEYDPVAVRNAYDAAIERFDAEGEAGVRRRSDYILESHMPRNRLIQMVDFVRNLDV